MITTSIRENVAPLIQLTSDQIEEGMSGAAVLDLEMKKVVGIISLHHPSKNADVDPGLNFAIPISLIIKVSEAAAVLIAKNPGLKPIFEFASKIRSDSIWYKRLEDLYVAPKEYEEIEKTLEEQRIVFITGSKEYGKTYTAIKLLWEYYKRGYKPEYVLEENAERLSQIIDSLLGDEKYKRCIIYFEDPVGKTEYKRNEKFQRHIASISTSILKRIDTRLVITMREEIYNEFRPTGKIDTKTYVKKLNIGKPSYSNQKRKEMLYKWASVMNCNWLTVYDSRDEILNSVENAVNLLPTPLNIKDFVMDTIDITDRDSLSQILTARSKETSRSFANDIYEMKLQDRLDNILFLCFPFISDEFSVDFINREYQPLLQELAPGKYDEYTFDRVKDRFQDNKIDIIGGKIRFSHPSYFEALPYILIDEDEEGTSTLTEINTRIFRRVLIELVPNIYASEYVAKRIVTNFNAMPEDIRDKLFVFVNDSSMTESIAKIVEENFDKLPQDTLYEILMNLVANDYKFIDTVEYIVNSIASRFNKLTANTKNLLFTLADNSDVSMILIKSISEYYDNIEDTTRQDLLVRIINANISNWEADEHQLEAELITQLLLSRFDSSNSISGTILLTFVDKKAVARYILPGISQYFDKLPAKLREELLQKAADYFYPVDAAAAAEDIARVVAENFDKLPAGQRESLLSKAANNYRAAYFVISAL